MALEMSENQKKRHCSLLECGVDWAGRHTEDISQPSVQGPGDPSRLAQGTGGHLRSEEQRIFLRHRTPEFWWVNHQSIDVQASLEVMGRQVTDINQWDRHDVILALGSHNQKPAS